MKAVFASHSAFDPVLRVGSHHLSREFARAGWSTAHVSTPISLMHITRLREPPVRRRFRQALGRQVDTDGVARIVPTTVRPITRLPAETVQREVSRAMQKWPELHAPDFLIIDQPLLVDLVDILRPRRVIYRPTDVHFDHRTREAELRALRVCHAVVATSQRVLEEVLTDSNATVPTLILENGVEYEHFAGTSSERDGFCYVGAVDRRFDWDFVTETAAAVGNTRVDIIGPVSAAPPTDLPPNVRALPSVAYSTVPEILRSYRVGMLPFNLEPGNAGRSPMKYYEYLAAGLNIWATPTPALIARDAPGVWFSKDGLHSDAVCALEAPENRAGIEYASGYSWETRASELRRFLEGLE